MNEDQLEFRWAEGDESPKPSVPARPVPRQSAPAPLAQSADLLRDELARRSGVNLLLRITDNRSTMMSVRYNRAGSQARLSLHRMFLNAPPEILTALAHWVKHPRGRKYAALLNGFIRARRHEIAPARPRAKATLQTNGAHHDLRALYDAVNAEHFECRIDARITWGKMPPPGRRRSIRFGSYMPGEHLIRIHPLLDQDFVPQWFVRYIVFHEMLHAELGIEEHPNGRRAIHPPKFKAIERAYPDYKRALEWERVSTNMKYLLHTRRR